MKNHLCLFERPFELQKKGIFRNIFLSYFFVKKILLSRRVEYVTGRG